MQRSLVYLIQKQEKDDVFKDAKDDENELSVNEWELQLKIQKSTIDLNCSIQDLRFVFAVPTAKKLVNVGVKTLEIFE